MLLLWLAMITAAQDPVSVDVRPTAEVRAYILDRNRRPVSPVGISALLVLGGLPPGRDQIPMTLHEPRGVEQLDALAPLEFRDIERSSLVAGLRVLTLGLETSAARPSEVPAAYFSARLTAEETAALPCEATLIFQIQGEVKAARGFSCAPADPQPPGATCGRLSDDLRALDRQLLADDRAGAEASLRRISDALPSLDGWSSRERDACFTGLRRLENALSSGRLADARASLQSLKSACDNGADPLIERR